jgi:uncharacterized protein (DUF736 family)
MTTKTKETKKEMTENEIDRIVVAQADINAAWEEPVKVRRRKMSSLSLPADLIGRADFIARLHRLAGSDEWLVRIIQERVEIEELAFSEAKRDLVIKRPPNKPLQRTAKRRR